MTPTIFITAALALAATLPVAPAQATGLARTFVSAAGSDSNNCANVATPCRHLATAYAATAANGEIYVLDPANYGSLTITGPVTIEGHGWASISPAGSTTAAITITAGSNDVVSLRGLTLNGTGVGADGVIFTTGGTLEVVDCTISNFAFNGIYVSPNTSMSLVVLNTVISNISQTASSGIYLDTSKTVTITATLNNVTFSDNTFGISMYATGGDINAMISNTQFASSVHSGNLAQIGIRAQGSQNVGQAFMTLKNVTLSNPGAVNIGLNGYTAVYLSQVVQVPTTDGFGIFPQNSNNSVYSDGTNHIPGLGVNFATWSSN